MRVRKWSSSEVCSTHLLSTSYEPCLIQQGQKWWHQAGEVGQYWWRSRVPWVAIVSFTSLTIVSNRGICTIFLGGPNAFSFFLTKKNGEVLLEVFFWQNPKSEAWIIVDHPFLIAVWRYPPLLSIGIFSGETALPGESPSKCNPPFSLQRRRG